MDGKIGPYRLGELLGSGGTGEVYRAWDERLGRAVAVKHLRPAAASDPRARERFEREARAAARLSHPAIVRVYDVLTGADGGWIVMELVEGRSLAEHLAGGPIAPATAVKLGREIAEGLAEAHAHGIVHRDLKTENVILTAEGRPKILDFGIARGLADASHSGARAHPEAVLGTARAMSPEQATGAALGPRSDLFALGTLLYEIATGQSPFLGESLAETLARVCHHQQPPAHELVPALPAELSELIDRLLAKEPAARPASAHEVAERLARMATPGREPSKERPVVEGSAGTGSFVRPGAPRVVRRRRWRWALAGAGLAVLLAVPLLLDSGPAPPRYVAVLRPTLAAGTELPDELLADAVRVALLRGLVGLRGLAPLAPEKVDALTGPPAVVARAAAVDELVSARLSQRASAIELTLARIDAGGGVAWSESFELPIDDLALLTRTVTARIRAGYPGFKSRDGLPATEVSSADQRAFLGLRHELASPERAQGHDELLARIEQLLQSSPRFFDAFLLAVRVYRLRFEGGRDRADLARARELLARARRLAPGDPEIPRHALQLALAAGELEAAESALAELERLDPGTTDLLASRAWLETRRGHAQEALALMRRAARRRPEQDLLLELANLELRQGETAAARHTLETLLEGSPNHLLGQTLLGQIELLDGRFERAAELFSRQVARSPSLGALANLGFAELMLGHYSQAAATLETASQRYPRNPFLALNLADARLLGGEPTRAQSTYEQVLELVDADPAATSWQFLSTRAQAEAHLGRFLEAVVSIRKATELAPHNPQAAYDAALVLTLVGDAASAQVYREEAIALGIPARWFELPWFYFSPVDHAEAPRP